MSSEILTIEEAIPSEYRELIGLYLNQGGKQQSPELMQRFAEALGVGKEFQSILGTGEGEKALRRLLGHFRNNVELLIQKTWVEKSDETYKEKLLDRLPSFIEDFVSGNFERSLKSFVLILDELAYLLFGQESRNPDFIEYAFRFDSHMGLFWWYAQNLSKRKPSDSEHTYHSLILGICYLAAF